MARIRTIKPEFFTSEDIVSLTPLARILYIALWCEADKEGRMVWKPTTFKLRYMPGDNCDINELCKEIADRGLVVLYGAGYAYIPSFKSHQHINPRETGSQLPEPNEKGTRHARVGTRQSRVSDWTVTHREEGKGREGKGKEGKEDSAEPPSDSPPPSDVVVSIPLVDKTEFQVNQEMIDEWKVSFPAVDIVGSLLRMRAWSNANPANKKTSRGVNAFIVRWLGKEQDNSARNGAKSFEKHPASDPDSRSAVEADGVAGGFGKWDESKEQWHQYKTRVRGGQGYARNIVNLVAGAMK